jgi:hypothetical protein
MPQPAVVVNLFKKVPILPAILLVVLANVALLIVNPADQLKIDVEKTPTARTWAWWGAQDFFHQKQRPDVVLLGSSVMMQGTWFQEAQYRQKPVELIVDHRTEYLETAIKRNTGVNARCFNFALPGSMCSDMTMTAKAMLNGERKPRIAVIGLTARDMMDNTFHCPAGTKHYRYMSKFVDTSNLQDLAVPSLADKPKFWFQNNCYFNSKAKLLTNSVGEMMRQLMVSSGVQASPLDKVADEDRRYALFKDELERGFWIAYPNNPQHFNDSAFDCVRRLKKPNDEMFKNQYQWLRLALEHCKSEGITPVLIGLPISPVARQTMSPAVYARHIQTLQELSHTYGCQFADLNDFHKYELSEFDDWAHPNATGGQHMLDGIAKVVSNVIQ